MALSVAIKEATASFPPPRPTAQTSSLTRFFGGDRDATAAKAAFCASSIGSALAAAFQTFQEGPRKYGSKSAGESIAAEMLIGFIT
jgi:hypothetical protein